MRKFTYLRPTDVAEALEQLNVHGDDARPIAGGQSLLLEMKGRARSPRLLVALSHLPELHGIRHDDDAVIIGAATTYRELIETGPDGPYSALSAVAADIADVPVRSLATIGGAICQGDPRFDIPVVLLALGAELVVRSAAGERRVAAEEFFGSAGPARLASNELVTEIRLPVRDAEFRWVFHKFRMRRMDTALISIAVSGLLDGTKLRFPVVAAGCLDRPTRLPAVERVLDGQPVASGAADDAAAALRAELRLPQRAWPFFEPDYLTEMGCVLLTDALTELSRPTPAVS